MPSFHALVAAVLAFLHLTALAAAGSPPACLLGAIQRLPNPADLASVCGTYMNVVEGNLTEACTGSDLSSAYQVYSATCSANGVQVKALPTSSSAAASSTATKGAKATGTATATGTGTGSSASGAAQTGSGTASGASASQTGKSIAGLTTTPQPVLFMLSGLLAIGLTNLLLL